MENQVFVSAYPADIDHNVLAMQVSGLQYQETSVVMGGRPATFDPVEAESNEWNLRDSRTLQKINAIRFSNFLAKVRKDYKIYDGGQSPRTIIKQSVHIKEHIAFDDWDHRDHRDLLLSTSQLAKKMGDSPYDFISGSPFTPFNTFDLYPDAVKNLRGIYAMHATWGKVNMMDLNQDGKKRGALQFNVACDPSATAYVVNKIQNGEWNTQLYLGTTECTRVKEIGFKSFNDLKSFLPKTDKTEAILPLYKVWYEKAVAPRQEKNPDEMIFIHNVIAGFLAQPEKREALYEIVPVKAEVPLDSENLGKMYLTETSEDSNIFATVKLKTGAEELYLEYLYNIFE